METVYTRLQSLETFGIKLGLQNIRQLLAGLGQPDQNYPSVLIAGTNGKGSVSAMMQAALSHNGYKTGLYVSPHLIDVRERIRINGNKIAEDAFTDCLSAVFRLSDDLRILPTHFEALTASAILHFAREKVDCAVLEAGMGGRLDATNAVQQKLSIITSIGLDHEVYLGKTLNEIATEKALISKPGIPTIAGVLAEPARSAVEKVCAETGSPLKIVDPSNILDIKINNGFGEFRYEPWDQTIRLSLRGRHQIENASIALLALTTLLEKGWSIDRDACVKAFASVRWPGRLDILPDFEPPLLVDCAHNPMGTRSLKQFLSDQQWSGCVFLFTAMQDKKFEEMLEIIAPLANCLVLCRVEPLNRCASEEELTAAAAKNNLKFVFDPNPVNALKQAMSLSRQAGLPLVVFGSIYLIGQVYSCLGVPT